MSDYYEWFKTIHIMALVAWMAGIFYLPRLYVYHTRAKVGSEMDKTFQIMEYRLLKFIMNPAMITTYIFGLSTAQIYGFKALGIWFHVKMLAVIIITIMHGLMASWRKDFAAGQNKHSENFYRVANEIPTVAFVIAVIMVVVKPFE
jgi:protoporphyrinogen IX oxidase